VVQGNTFTWTRGKLIGRGALGLVYRAEAEGSVIAVKEVALDVDDARFRQDLENEIQIMKDLKHPFIVSYLGHDYLDDRLYLYMDFMPGGSVSQVLKEHGPLDEGLMATYVKQLLKGLEYLHTRSPSVIHRDIKGGNVLVGVDSIVKWADFGCSKMETESEKTQTMLRGSIPWMAPEVVANSRYGKSSDIWSFGCLMIEMATARTPWGSFDNQVQALIKIGMSSEIPPMPEGISEDSQGLITQCLQRDAQLRPSACELLQHTMVKDIPLPI
jgi:serine/threonine protein kinase